LARAFPRYTYANATALKNDLINAGVDVQVFRPDQAIVFWLNGFNPDITRPFYNLSSLTKAQRTPQFFSFDDSRLVSFPVTAGNTIPSYFPQGIKTDGSQGPYVYFDNHAITGPGGNAATFYGMPPVAVGLGQPAVANAFNSNTSPTISPSDIPAREIFGLNGSVGPVMPYWSDINGNSHSVTSVGLDPGEDWINADSFQIIGPGGDGAYGSTPAAFFGARMYPSGNTEGNAPTAPTPPSKDEDNVTNFCARARLGDAKP
jgi:hypothetical protein